MTETQQWPPKAVHEKVAAVKLAAGFYRERGAREQAVRAFYGPALPNMIRFWQIIRILITEEAVIMQAPMEIGRIRARERTPQQKAALSRARRITRERAW